MKTNEIVIDLECTITSNRIDIVMKQATLITDSNTIKTHHIIRQQQIHHLRRIIANHRV